MTPVPLELPLRPAEATELANLIFDHAERKPLTDEVRTRLSARAAALRLKTVTPYFGSLERDPVHPSVYYLAVDAQSGPQLLHVALASAPTSGIYHRALLIGRMRRVNGPEMVINAIPFGPEDREAVEMFAARINAAFYPQPQGARATITIEEDPESAFGFFRALQKRTGQNFAALAGDYHAAMWAAIRAGWRSGYTAGIDIHGEIPKAAYSRYTVSISSTETGLKEAEAEHERIRRVRAGLRIARAFDFELILESPIASGALREALEYLREGAHSPQLVGGAFAGDLSAIAEVASQFQITLTLSSDCAVTGPRFNYRVKTAAMAESLAENRL